MIILSNLTYQTTPSQAKQQQKLMKAGRENKEIWWLVEGLGLEAEQ